MARTRLELAETWESLDTGVDFMHLLCANPKTIQDDGAQRKLRLMSCAVARLVWHHLADEAMKEWVTITERFAEGQIKGKDFISVSTAAKKACRTLGQSLRSLDKARMNRSYTALFVLNLATSRDFTKIEAAMVVDDIRFLVMSEQDFIRGFHIPSGTWNTDDLPPDPTPALIRDIFGNPFRPIAFDKRWQTSTVRALADAIAAEAAFDRLPILADALEEAGCDHAEILGHCRGEGPHVRGCWVVDLIRGKHWQPRVKK